MTVSELTRYLRLMLEADYRLQSVWIEGEVSNLRQSPAGHCYFTLKDATAQLRCAWFCNSIGLGATIPRDGDHVIVHGRVSIYEARGEYQMYVNLVQPSGQGALALQFEELRARLEHEGLFDAARKRPLPSYPRIIGIVTSPVGAVLHDIVTVIGRRFAGVELVIAPTAVQGEDAELQIVGAIEALNAFAHPDVIIVARGGGSAEDLAAFNHELVARTIYGSAAPIVAAIGHETDVTIADFVADLRAPTPSAAAELVVPDGVDLAQHLDELRRRLRGLVVGHIERARQDAALAEERLARRSPIATIADHRMIIDGLAERAATQLGHLLALRRAQLDGLSGQIEALSPRSILDRGYSITRVAPSGQLVRSVADIHPGAAIEVQLGDGRFPATVDGSVWQAITLPGEVIERGV